MSAVKPPTLNSKKEEMSEYIFQIYKRVADEEKALKKVKISIHTNYSEWPKSEQLKYEQPKSEQPKSERNKVSISGRNLVI